MLCGLLRPGSGLARVAGLDVVAQTSSVAASPAQGGVGRFALDEAAARDAHAGIWASCFANPRDHRYTNKAAAVLLGKCPMTLDELTLVRDELFGVTPTIKAKVFATGRQLVEGVRGIFHREGCASFGKMPNEQDGTTLLFFASADDAKANGFRLAKNCMRP